MSDSMYEEVAAFPLCWPEGWPRTAPSKRSASRFADWTVFTAIERLREEIRLMDARDVIVSTSIPLRRDGLPYSRPPVDGDPGAAVYFTRRKRAQCIAIDGYLDVADNIRAITLTLKAMRDIERHGGAEILDRAFTGFAALPQTAGSGGRSWHDVLGLAPNATADQVKAAYRSKIKEAHPDTGGSDQAATELNLALEQGLRSATPSQVTPK